MILRGGFNVYPRELEEVMLTHPAISLVAVIGVPDERLGEEVKAFVVKKPGADADRGRAAGLVQGAVRRLQVSRGSSSSARSCRRARPERS